jgi:hypothetical protein
MVSKVTLLQKLKPYVGSLKIVKYDQGTNDIIKELLKSHQEQTSEYDKIYPYFVGKNVRETAQNIFDFLKRNVKYNIEPGSKQTLKSPSSILAQGYGDCKQYAQFAGGVLDAIKRNINGADWCYRFASYNPEKQIQHVFVVVKDKSGKMIWIDPVLKALDQRKDYTFKIDKKPNSMALYKISGTDEIGKISLKKLSLKNIAKVAKKVAKPLGKALKVATSLTPAGAGLNLAKGGLKKLAKGAIKKVAKKVTAKGAIKKLAKGAIKKATKGGLAKVVIKVGTVPSRNAFLTLVKANKAGLATKLGASLSTVQTDLKQAWESLGGKYNTLASTILKGSKESISGVDSYYYVSGIGAVDISKTYTTALPVIKKLENILKSVGIDVDSIVEKGSDEALKQVSESVAVNQGGEIVDNPNTPSTETTNQPVIEPNAQQQTAEAVESTVIPQGDTAVVDIKSQSGGGYTKFIIPAVALGALYYFSKKKR